MTSLFILTRAIHIGACLLFFATFAFDRFVAVTVAQVSAINADRRRYTQWSTGILLLLLLVSGIAWYVLVSVTMSGEELDLATLKTVWANTQFGKVSAFRLIFWTTSALLVLLSGRLSIAQKSSRDAQLVLSGCLLGSLAWMGHGRESSNWHLAADIIHLLAAGLWPTGLMPFAFLLNYLHHHQETEKSPSIGVLVRRFSALSLGTVALLTVTGVINSWYLLNSFSDLFTEPYGRWLLAKTLLFFVTVGIGAINLHRLKPQLLPNNLSQESAHPVVTQLQINVLLELVLGTFIVIIVAVLGILPP
jgi:putative copper resistance protein D